MFNHAPSAGGAAYNTPEDTALHVAAPGLLATGTDFDGDAFTALRELALVLNALFPLQPFA